MSTCVLLGRKYLFVLVCALILTASSAQNHLQVGTSIADITGPVADANTMGYAHARLSGLHMRLFSRAFAFRDYKGNCAAYAVLDLAMVSHLLAFTVGQRISKATNGRYTESNVMLSATHTHAGPGGYNQDLFLALNTPGFDREYFNYIVDGVVQSILQADRSLAPARVLSNSGELFNASVNRHPHQYLLNPPEERARYASNVDTEMFLLRFDNGLTGRPIGSIAWFPVHGTSLKVSNQYVSGDNKGVASQLMERHFNAVDGSSFVAAFPQSHSGDVTPNTRGVFRFDPDDGDAEDWSDEASATAVRCNSSALNTFECESRAPGSDQYNSVRIIGQLQFNKALQLHQSASRELPQPLTLSVIHDTRDVSEEAFPAALARAKSFSGNASRLLKACKAAIGYAFCAGTADGRGVFSYFTNGRQRASVLVDAVRDLLAKVTPEDAACHGSKRICLNVGKIFWSGIPFMSSQIPTQLLRLGSVFILALPTEVTTMAGRRLINSLSRTKSFPKDGKVLINGLSNGYYFYVTTEEEYNGSYYEAGATLFGPHTLNFYAWHAGRLLRTLLANPEAENDGFRPRPTPEDLDRSRQLDSMFGDGGKSGSIDFAGFGTEFGQQIADMKDTYQQGDSVELKFIACHPRNSFGISGHSFLLIERYNSGLHRWETAADDNNLETRFRWLRTDFFQSLALVCWDIPANQWPGYYRISYRGHCRTFASALTETAGALGRMWTSWQSTLTSVEGVSRRFRVVAREGNSQIKLEGLEVRNLPVSLASSLSASVNSASAESCHMRLLVLLLLLLLPTLIPLLTVSSPWSNL